MRCSKCKSVSISQISLFKISQQRSSVAHCRCGTRLFSLEREGRVLYLYVRCGHCTDAHEFAFDARAFCDQIYMKIDCPGMLQALLFVGQEVGAKMAERLPHISPSLGEDIPDEYFTDPEVMYETLNHLHDLAGNGEVSCDCGSGSAEVEIFADRVVLRCDCCGRSWTVHARNQRDLSQIKSTSSITMTESSIGDRSHRDNL